MRTGTQQLTGRTMITGTQQITGRTMRTDTKQVTGRTMRTGIQLLIGRIRRTGTTTGEIDDFFMRIYFKFYTIDNPMLFFFPIYPNYVYINYLT